MVMDVNSVGPSVLMFSRRRAGYLSGYLGLTEFAKFQPGQTVLAPAIGSAVGMETLQVARRLGASMTISTAGTTQVQRKRPSRHAPPVTRMSSTCPTRA